MSQYAQYSVSKVFGMPSIPEKVVAVGCMPITTNPFIPATDPRLRFPQRVQCVRFWPSSKGTWR